jgi:poly-gamma-glutamate capsule biosynthesis protein CapA/YwtB (metallophosphatase superfamily)
MNRNTKIANALAVGLTLACGVESASAASPARGWESAAGEETQTVFALTGDAIINRRLSTFRAPGVNDMFELIRKADVAFTNFETLIHDFTLAGAQQSGGTYMGSPRFVTDELAWAGFDLLGLANNHVNDYGVDGMRSTVAALAKTDFVYSGVGENLALARKPGYLDTPKGRVALISTSSSFPAPIVAGPQRKDMPGRPGLNPLRHTVTYTVPQATYDTLSTLRGPGGSNMGEAASSALSFGGAEYVVGDEIKINSRANKTDIEELQASVRDADQQSDWVVVSIHAHEASSPKDRWMPAEFVVEFAHAMIDAGADMVVGHGPHILRGIEVYKGKPIFYSLANFIFENDLVELQPADNYDKTALAGTSLPSDYFTKRSKNDTVGFPADRKFWQSVIAEVVYANDRTLQSVRLHPVSMGFGQPRSKRGQPYPAPAAEAEQIFKDLQEVSAPFGTSVSYKNGVGTLSWKN